jgi:hypothetical protein
MRQRGPRAHPTCIRVRSVLGLDVTSQHMVMKSASLLSLSLLSLCALAQSERATFVPREGDIVAAFPELRGDRKLSACSNSIMSGATRFVFVSDMSENEVTIKSVHCSRVDKGLSCGAVHREKHYFLESPEQFFSLENLTLDQARPILEAYQGDRITGLPDWFGAGRPRVRAIQALPDGRYRMHFGDYYCSGCAFVFNVRLETNGGEARLIYVGDPDGGCF